MAEKGKKKALHLIGKRVLELREACELTQMELAVRAGLTLSNVTQIEHDTIKDPRLSTVRALAGALGVTVSELLGEGKCEAVEET